ncbi:MAG TPA: AmmeMemoRadiSam system radical SAM enzyme [Thermodesulfobacteriota bacterium]|nr:AmmeMemoRadiSam system radical SAM enzyme [Thermodesulfobacteriota bacterium]
MMREAMLYNKLEDQKVACYLCNHHCRIADMQFGICGMRQNQAGKLYTHAYGEVIAANVDPIEKKPLYHFLPGTTSFSIATPGCNFRCGFCQNWQISQASKKKGQGRSNYQLLPDEVVREAKANECRSISYTYTEPTIFFEYAYDTSKLAKKESLFNVFVTNGYMTTESLETIAPYLDACNVDLKSFREDFYKSICGGHLEPVLESIRCLKRLNIWVEITTLVIPELNDSDEELSQIARFISEVDVNIPWHISRFHPDYKLTDSQITPLETLTKAYSLGRKAGLRYIYIGNIPGESPQTVCPACNQPLIRRRSFWVLENNIRNSRCPQCGECVPGVF